MEDKAIAVVDVAAVLEKVITAGDLSTLSPADRVGYYRAVCESIGVNPLTRPFDYIVLNGKLTLYANKSCTDQLRGTRRISAAITARERVEDIYIVTARVTDPSGRTDESTGAVSVAGLRGDALANSYMKAETKSKRRATLSLVGLGMLDETEVETIPNARRVTVEEADALPAAPVVRLAPPVGDTRQAAPTQSGGREDWTLFWRTAKEMGYKDAHAVNAALGVKDIGEWMAKGTQASALETLQKLAG